MSLLNEARSILEDVPTRLRLLASTRPAATTPLAREEPDWAFAQKLASACEAASAWTQSFEAAGSPLQKAILLAKLPACRATLDEISQMLETRAGSLKERLHEIDTRWPEVAREDLESLADAWTFWKRQQTRFHESLLSIEAAAPA